MATIEPNKEWFEDKVGKRIEIEWPTGEKYIISVERGESDG